jgi:phage repressor protein C with HTH and peptisase S24 domain
MSLAERLKTARESMGFEQKKLADQLGISFRSWQDYELGKSVPGGKVFEALVKAGFNANWLLTGDGEMKRGDTAYPLADGLKTADIGGELAEGFVQVPRYKVAASAGGGAVIHSEQVVDHLSFRADWVYNALGVPVSSLALINVIGDSMEPTLSEGDLILIDMSHRGVKDNSVYVLQLGGELLVKRIQRKLDGSVVVKSDNSAAYEPETVPSEGLELLNVIGRVVWCGRRM